MLKESEGKSWFNLPPMEQLDSGEGMITIYRVAFQYQLESLFKYGYNRAFTGSKGGNMYGPGVYCTFSLSDSINNVRTKPEYGDCIVAMRLVGGYSNFIIFDEALARRQYGKNWRIRDQLANTYNFPREWANRVEAECKKCGSLYHDRTAPAAHRLWQLLRKNIYKSHHIRGLIYTGNRDGHCALPYDFSNVIPYAVSFDQGRTFTKKLTSQLYQFLKDHIDVDFRFGGQYEKVFQSIKGFTMVMNDSQKYNVIQNETDRLLSDVWFDEVQSQINPRTGLFGFKYLGIDFIGSINTPDGADGIGCICDPDGDPYDEFSALDQLARDIQASGAKTFEEYLFMEDEHEEDVEDFKESARPRTITLTEQGLKAYLSEAVRRFLNEDRTVDKDGCVTVDNFDMAKRKLFNAESDDDVWFVQIVKRHKDNLHQHFTHNACDYIASYLIHSEDELSSKEQEIKYVCHATNARAYIYPNKRSLVAITDYANNVLKPRFARHRSPKRGHEIEVAAGQPKDWPERRLCFLDIDSDDVNVYNQVMKILSDAGIQPMEEYRSVNNGWHILLPDKEQVKGLDFSVVDRGMKFGRFSTVGLEIDRPILLYASLRPNGYGVQQRVQQRKVRHMHA